MGQPNLVSLNISEGDLGEIKGAIDVLVTKLLPHLKTLGPEERQELPKMGMKTMGFVQKGVEHCQQNPDLVPAYLNVEELVTDFKAVEMIRSMYQPLLQVTEGLADTMTLSGSEALGGVLIFYNAVRYGKKARVQKAETVYNDLRARYPGKSR
ncbi:MAG: hypothetical protein GXY86_16605, partial [Firmicutes bacterium]|nr:hypothetical protein [Bacillota bacterium]